MDVKFTGKIVDDADGIKRAHIIIENNLLNWVYLREEDLQMIIDECSKAKKAIHKTGNLEKDCYYCNDGTPARREFVGKISEPICEYHANTVYRAVPIIKKKEK